LKAEEGKIRVLIDGLWQDAGVIPKIPTEQFTRMIGQGIALVESCTYELCERISAMTKRPFKDAFAAVRYSNFLARYKGARLDIALRDAMSKLGL
jgi:hypothetical protein